MKTKIVQSAVLGGLLVSMTGNVWLYRNQVVIVAGNPRPESYYSGLLKDVTAANDSYLASVEKLWTYSCVLAANNEPARMVYCRDAMNRSKPK